MSDRVKRATKALRKLIPEYPVEQREEIAEAVLAAADGDVTIEGLKSRPARVPRVGDEVLIRGRVKDFISGVGVNVELFSKTDQYPAWVREDLVEKVIPADQTRTFKGFTVAATRQAIRQLDAQIEGARTTNINNELGDLMVASLEGARADLVDQLEAIGVPVEDPS